MWPVTQKFLDTLSRSHTQLIGVDVLKAGQVVASLQNGWMTDPVAGNRVATIGGSIAASKTTIRRSGTINFLDVSGQLVPDSVDDLFAPYSTELRIWSGVRYWDAAAVTGDDFTTSEYVPVGTLVITHLANNYPQLTLEGYDRMWYLDKFQSPWTIDAHTSIASAIIDLLRLKVPNAVLDYDIPQTDDFTTSALIYDADTSSADAIFSLAGNSGNALYCDPTGKFVLTEEPSTDDPPVMTYAPGAFSQLPQRPSRTIGDATMYNAVVVTSEGTTTAPIRGYAQDDNPASLTYVGAVGVHPAFVSDPTITTQAQADRAAQRHLRSVLGVSITTAVPVIPNPAYEVGDVIVVSDSRQNLATTLMLDSFPVPLRAQDGIQALTCRSDVISSNSTDVGQPPPPPPPPPPATMPPSYTPSRVLTFNTAVALGSWPGDGTGPSAYPSVLSYADATANKYYPSQVLSVHDGMLDWYCHNDMAAVALPFGYTGYTYGTFNIRMRVDNFDGYHVAFLFWPLTNQWTDEIDFPESDTILNNPYMAVLQDPTTSKFLPSGTPRTPLSWHDAAWHDYTLDWQAGWVRGYQDGVLFAEVDSPNRIPAQPMRWTLQVEWKGSSNTAPDPSLNGHVYVQSCKYWAPA